MFAFARTITISFADYVAFNKIHIGNFRIKPIWIWIIISAFSIFIFLTGYSTDSRAETWSKPFVVFLFFFIYALSAVVIWLLILLVKLLHRLILYIIYKLNPHTFTNIEVLINEKGIEYKTARNNYIALWQQITRVCEDRERYFIYYAKNAVFILPKHNIGLLDERAKFANFLKAFANPDLKYLDSE